MDKEDKINMALNTICDALYDGFLDRLEIDEYNCDLFDCKTCLFNDLDTFREFLKKYRHDKSYGNGGGE